MISEIGDAFSPAALSRIVQDIPQMFDLAGRHKLFGASVFATAHIVDIEINNEILTVLPALPRGAPSTRGSTGKRRRVRFEVPHIPHEDVASIADTQNLQQITGDVGEAFLNQVSRRLGNMVRKHQLTHEWYRVRALQGEILDADGSTLLNLFQSFGVQERLVDFSGPKSVSSYSRQVKGLIEDELGAHNYANIVALCSEGFMEALLRDVEVLSAHDGAAHRGRNPRTDDVRLEFEHQGVVFREYRARADVLLPNGSNIERAFIPAGEARFVPIGLYPMSVEVYAPPDFAESVNIAPDQAIYAKSELAKFGRGLELHTQSNFLPVWTRPATLVRATI